MSRDKAIFQSTRPVRGATTLRETARRAGRFQSTRPVRGAMPIFPRCGVDRLISIHAPRAGRDAMFGNMQTESTLFQSTRPVRGATTARLARITPSWYFNPRAPCGARRRETMAVRQITTISIHAPRAGRDVFSNDKAIMGFAFQSTRPVRGATAALMPCLSISEFQSTRPVRGATLIRPLVDADAGISIHAPRAGRDWLIAYLGGVGIISIHAPRAGRD